MVISSAGIAGATIPFVHDPHAPERRSTASYGMALFESQTDQDWAKTFATNTTSVLFVTTAFLGLLEAGALDTTTPDETASVINVTSCVSSMNVSLFYVRSIPFA